MSQRKFLRAAMTFWLLVGTACNAAQPLTPTTAVTVTITSTPTPVPVAGCEAQEIDLTKYGGVEFQNPEVLQAVDGVLDTSLEVKYGDNKIAACPVHLRSYNGKLVGPTLRVKPGEKLQLIVKNMLPPNAPMDHTNMEIPHDFNTTNLHTHGLHVSPSGISDNVLREMPPPEAGSPSSDYEVVVDIPADHPAGTFWYHPHSHGSTSIQVTSGMEGALIIEGGLDQVPEIAAAQEQIFVLQQISYDTEGEVEDFDTSLGFGNWERNHRQYTVNGQLNPTLTMRPGELQRWRMIHGGVEETILATLRGPGLDNLTVLTDINKLPLNTLNEIAADGLALGKMDAWDQVELEPGYRSDVLVKLEKPGTYYLVDDGTDKNTSLLGVAESEKIIARIQVAGDALDMPLPSAAALAPLKPMKDIADGDLTGPNQTLVFCMCKDATTGTFKFTVNGAEFDPTQSRKLKLNAVEEWDVSTDPISIAPTHPFHIHVNPFQATRTGPDGQPEIVWKDTILIKQGEPQKLRMRYEDFTGKFVMHCHILDHEDQGMMEVDEVTE